MLELFQKFSFLEIITFIIFLAIAIKSVISFFEWVQQRISKVLRFKTGKMSEKEEMKKQLSNNTTLIEKLAEKQVNTDDYLKTISNKIDMLVDSDKDAIKSYITREHHKFCYDLKEIDDFSLDCLEKRFKHYEDQGGNSFIESFMQDLRKLPRHYHN